jgi:flagellum-specific peptidoglycan hydrolase FlgJ
MSNNNSKPVVLKVVFKQETDTTVPQQQPIMNNNHITRESFGEGLDRLIRRFYRLKAAFMYQIERRTYGFFEQKHSLTILKVCILAIIMLFILKRDIAFDYKTPNFAEEKTNKEKKYTDNHNKKDYATQASFGKVVTDLSPASPEELREGQVRDYIDKFSNASVTEMDKFGIPASITMAQAIIESRSGSSILAVRNNNHFGIKCFSKSCPNGHCSNHTDDHHKDFFRIYKGPQESWREHSNFLMKNSYKKLLKYGKDYKAWARGLREYGYATDVNYDRKLIAIIERYELHRLDNL